MPVLYHVSQAQDALFSLLMWQNRKALAVNAAIIVFLIFYTLLGGFVFLHFERGYQEFLRQNETRTKTRCIEDVLVGSRNQLRVLREADFAREITKKCLMEWSGDPKHEWSYKTAALYGFGILTTLGYGKIEPKTTNGRIFAVIYGFLGIPITVILLTNIGRYLESLAMRLRNMCTREKKDISCNDSISTSTLFFIVVFYLTFGAVFIPLLNGKFDFFNGIYFAFICLTAIEYGDLVPHNNYYVPVVLVYVCIGLAISTIALDIGSMYVRKLHYIGQKLKNIANIKIWFGSKDLRISEFVSAVGANIGIEESVLSDIDLENLVKVAILVKEGRLSKIPQTHMIVEGIWPPELVPLFMKDGQFPVFVDQDDIREKEIIKKKRGVVRFEDEVRSIDDSSQTEPSSQQLSRLSPPAITDSSMDRALRINPSAMTSSQVTTNSSSLLSDSHRDYYGRIRGGPPTESPDSVPPDTPSQAAETPSFDATTTEECLIHESISSIDFSTASHVQQATEVQLPTSQSCTERLDRTHELEQELIKRRESDSACKGESPSRKTPKKLFFKGSPLRALAMRKVSGAEKAALRTAELQQTISKQREPQRFMATGTHIIHRRSLKRTSSKERKTLQEEGKRAEPLTAQLIDVGDVSASTSAAQPTGRHPVPKPRRSWIEEHSKAPSASSPPKLDLSKLEGILHADDDQDRAYQND